jgi:hypothetical protein|tara:strand:- start:382 stop:525 length:144 start_codon:yes stop_codon:yes gene_type:complete
VPAAVALVTHVSLPLIAPPPHEKPVPVSNTVAWLAANVKRVQSMLRK